MSKDFTRAILANKSPDLHFRKAWNGYIKENNWLMTGPKVHRETIKMLAIMNYRDHGMLNIQASVDQFVEGLYKMAYEQK